MKLGPNDVVRLHLYLALKDPKLFIVTCVVLWGVFGWVSSKDKATHLSHLTVNKDIFNNVQSRENEQAGTCAHILGALSPPGSLENSHLTVDILLWPYPSENTPKHKTPGQTKCHLLFRTNNSLSVSDFFFILQEMKNKKILKLNDRFKNKYKLFVLKRLKLDLTAMFLFSGLTSQIC